MSAADYSLDQVAQRLFRQIDHERFVVYLDNGRPSVNWAALSQLISERTGFLLKPGRLQMIVEQPGHGTPIGLHEAAAIADALGFDLRKLAKDDIPKQQSQRPLWEVLADSTTSPRGRRRR
jgi:hypothetical protein